MGHLQTVKYVLNSSICNTSQQQQQQEQEQEQEQQQQLLNS